jgi:S-adenosylmethionine decarboxylase
MESKGKHLLIDCRNVPKHVCLDDEKMLNVLAAAAKKAGSTVISQVRYKFGHNSPPGFTVFVMLDESHCSAHSYAEAGLIAMDIFTCGKTDPENVLKYVIHELDLGTATVKSISRFV